MSERASKSQITTSLTRTFSSVFIRLGLVDGAERIMGEIIININHFPE